MNTLVLILASNILISLIAFIGLITLYIKEQLFQKIMVVLVALSAGALMGGAFLHLIPEAIEGFETEPVFLSVLIGFAFFFLVEKVLHWHHCHEGECPVHTFAQMSLLGEAVHNFLDGLTIAAGFIASPSLGLATVLAVALHEIPQEIGDFGVLVYGGFGKSKALALNFAVALTAVLGGLLGFFLIGSVNLVPFLLSFAAGGFIYVSSSDLIPEIKKETDLKKSIINFSVFILGLVLMYFLKVVSHD